MLVVVADGHVCTCWGQLIFNCGWPGGWSAFDWAGVRGVMPLANEMQPVPVSVFLLTVSHLLFANQLPVSSENASTDQIEMSLL